MRIAPAPSGPRRPSACRRATARPQSEPPTGSGRGPAPAPERNGRSPRSFLLPGALFPAALLLQRVDDLLRHILLVVLGQHRVSLEAAAGLERAFRNNAL